mgnify:FL=1|tara:strand:+ start:1524 stop:2402 length:879 start_codon:yes stop_codon:yes gene_type:complete
MKNILIIILSIFFTNLTLASDEKPGRSIVDRPDVTEEPQIHFIYLVPLNGKDREWDINGKMEEEMLKANELLYKMTGNKQKFRYDVTKDGKLDISFVRFDRKCKKCGEGWGMNYPDWYLTKLGFNKPNKLYWTYADVNNRDGGSGSVHHGYLFLKNKHNKGSNKRIILTVHELMHVNGFSYRCTKGHAKGHVSGTIIGGPNGGDVKKLGSLYDHGDPTCPDLKDSVFLTPTSDNPFNPVILKCAMAAEVERGKAPDPSYDWRTRYNHKRMMKVIKNQTWCTYDLSSYATWIE